MKSKLLTAALISVALITGCKKKPPLHPPTPGPGEANPRVAIKLNQAYLSAANIDSATLVWEINGQVQEAKMQLSNDTLFTETKSFSKGTGQLTVQIYSTLLLRQQKLQWEKRTALTMIEKGSVNWEAPAHYDDAGWFPRVILVDGPTKFTAIVALRPADPYFLLKNVPAGFKIELERHYTKVPGGAVIVGGGLWKCNTICTDARGIIENREFFRNLPSQIGSQEWKMVGIGIGLFGSNNTSGPGFYFNHY
jgi:hypothetical protein